MKDTWARQEFYRWYFYKQDNVLNVSLYDTYRPVIPRVTFLADGQHSIIARQAFSILLNVVDDLTGWRRVIIKVCYFYYFLFIFINLYILIYIELFESTSTRNHIFS